MTVVVLDVTVAVIDVTVGVIDRIEVRDLRDLIEASAVKNMHLQEMKLKSVSKKVLMTISAAEKWFVLSKEKAAFQAE